MLTHANSNLNADEPEGIYGNRVRSGMREMVNVVALDKGAGDKRK